MGKTRYRRSLSPYTVQLLPLLCDMNLKKYIKYFLLLTVFLPSFASADVLLSQSVATTSTNSLNGAGGELIIQQLGTGLTGTLSSVQLTLSRQSVYSNPFINITCFTDTTYSTTCPSGTIVATSGSVNVIASSPTVYTFTFSNFYNFVSTNAYIIQYNNGGSTKVYGSSISSSYPAGLAVSNGSGLNGLKSIYFTLYTSDVLSQTETAIKSIRSPTVGTTTYSTNVAFDFDYFVGTTYVNKVGLQIEDTFGGQTLNIPEQDVLASGNGSYYNILTLVYSHGYRWRPYLRYGSDYIYGPWRNFAVVLNPVYATSTLPYSPVITPTNVTTTTVSSFATSTASSTAYDIDIYEISSWCSGTNFIATMTYKFPFSYICDFGTVIDELSTGSGSTDISVTFPTSITGGQGQVLPILDSSFLVDLELMQQLKRIMAYALWFMFAISVYFSIMRVLKFR